VRAALVRRFGEGILDEAGQIDRSAVAQIVFRDRGALEWLERLLHPLVSAEYMRWRAELARRDEPPTVAATEVPLLYESGAERRFDAVVLITAPLGLRRARRQAPSDPRELRLIPDREKAKRADYVYVNDRGFDELDAFVERVVAELSETAAM
jgi:dephospho-CoA kinase